MNTDLRKILGIHLGFFVSNEEYSQIIVSRLLNSTDYPNMRKNLFSSLNIFLI